MLSFIQYLAEAKSKTISDHEDHKAWVSPSGNVHKFSHKTEHKDNIHPDLKGKVGTHTRYRDSLNHHGFARVGKYHDGDYIHFNHEHPHSVQSALHALKHLGRDKGHPTIIAHKTDIDQHTEKTFDHPLAARNYIKSFQHS